MSEWFCRSLFGIKCTPTGNDGRDHDQCGWITPLGDTESIMSHLAEDWDSPEDEVYVAPPR